ncbi:PAS domain-containing protein [Rhizobium sp. S163]|uniref:PAS domain-containing protein n=1 Tax=Rhizobium sp. S163 TaxID=3055039 RepID=UPI0025A9CDB5|nr:PAS domain-containing protein [Rhizobium sp. S163]MDM9644398.1 PAS domain-containing protein [Rhizobium sp. S163]
MGGVVLGLFQAFSLRCSQIDEAIRLGDDARVSSLDGSIDALIETILGYRATNLFYAHMQMQFVGCLIDQYAEDSESVREHVKLLAYMMEQYLGSTVPRWQMPPLERMDRERVSAPAAYVPNTDNGNFLNSAILESLPDRVAVVTKDYRYLYANAASAAYAKRKPFEMVGRHIKEVLGEARFVDCIKGMLDTCFAGGTCDQTYERPEENAVHRTRYRMSPLRDSSGYIIGALIVSQDAGASSSAANLAA